MDLKLTKLQIEVLKALKQGGLLTIDSNNMPWLETRSLQPQTRYFLTKNKLVTRKDTTRPAEAQGNGFIISPKGLATLAVLENKIGVSLHSEA